MPFHNGSKRKRRHASDRNWKQAELASKKLLADLQKLWPWHCCKKPSTAEPEPYFCTKLLVPYPVHFIALILDGNSRACYARMRKLGLFGEKNPDLWLLSNDGSFAGFRIRIWPRRITRIRISNSAFDAKFFIWGCAPIWCAFKYQCYLLLYLLLFQGTFQKKKSEKMTRCAPYVRNNLI